MLKKYRITLNGCDDGTTFEMEVIQEQIEFLKKVCELSKEHSNYTCMPTMDIEECEE